MLPRPAKAEESMSSGVPTPRKCRPLWSFGSCPDIGATLCFDLDSTAASVIPLTVFRAYSTTLPVLLVCFGGQPETQQDLPTLDQRVGKRRHWLRCTASHTAHPVRVFGRARFQSPFLTCCNRHHHNQLRKSMASFVLPDSPIFRGRYTLKLCIDPSGLRHWVPANQGFPRPPYAIARALKPTCLVQVRPFRAALDRDFHPFTLNRTAPITGGSVSVSPNLPGLAP
jgi:hypothetical protein